MLVLPTRMTSQIYYSSLIADSAGGERNGTKPMTVVSTTEINFPGEILLDANRWAPEVVASGGLALLLSVYLQAPSSSFHVCIGKSEELWDASNPSQSRL